MENKQNRYKLSGSLQFLTTGERGIIFSKDTILDNIRQYKERIKENGFMLGELNHQDNDFITLSNASHHICDIDINDDLNYTVEIEPLDTPMGKQLQMLLDNGEATISFRGNGNVWDEKINEEEKTIESLSTISFDILDARDIINKDNTNDDLYAPTAVEMPIPLVDRDSVSIRTNDEYQDLKNSIMQLIHHIGIWCRKFRCCNNVKKFRRLLR